MRQRVFFPGTVPGIFLVSLLIWAAHGAAMPLPGHAAPPLTIATVLSISGDRAEEGRAVRDGIEMYLDQVNRKGGVDGGKITLQVFDDRSLDNNSVKMAEQVAASKALVVLGHQYSTHSVAAGAVYRAKKIPAITGTATADSVTRGNPWYFRTVFNNGRQGRMCAYYAYYALWHTTATIIYDENDYGRSLKVGFFKWARKLGMDINDIHLFGSEREQDLSRELDGIADAVMAEQEPGIIFLAMSGDEASRLIRRFRDAGRYDLTLMSANRIGKQGFVDKFSHLTLAQASPGFYTDGIHASTDMLFDVASQSALAFRRDFMKRYGKAADAGAAYFYDAAMVAVEALKKAGVTGGNTAEDRRRVRESLAGINSLAEAVHGVTGTIFFDENGDAIKSVPVGEFRDNRFVSAALQLAPVTNLRKVKEYDQSWKMGHAESWESDVIRIREGAYLKEIQVVYTGIHINKISDINFREGTCAMDFNLWFRYEGDFESDRVEFLNAEGKVFMGNPVEKSGDGRMKYVLYHIKGVFRIDFLPDRFTYNRHALGVSIRHKELTREKLIFVVDLVKMDPEAMLAGMRRKKVVGGGGELSVKNISFFQSIEKRNSLGDPRYPVGRGQLSYSGLNAVIDVENTSFSIRGIIPEKVAPYVFLAAFLLLTTTTLARNISFGKRHGKLVWFLESLSFILLLLAGEIVLVGWQVGMMNSDNVKSVVTAFSILWWGVPAYAAVRAIRTFFFVPVEEKSGRRIPRIIYHMVSFLVYNLALFAVVAFVFNQKLTGILATSGVLAMIIGLAIQINISNVFSGIAINIERPFRVGDWVKIENYKEACVADVTWRTTRLKTRDGCIVSIPNSVASEAVVHNFNYPDDRYELVIPIHVEPLHRPERVGKIVRDALQSLEFTVNEPDTGISFRGYTEWSAEFVVLPVMTDYAKKNVFRSILMGRMWDYLDRAGIKPAVPRTEVRRIPREPWIGGGGVSGVELLNRLSLFDPFPPEEKENLGGMLAQCSFEPGECITGTETGHGNGMLWLIEEGIVGVFSSEASGGFDEMARLGPGSVFGSGSELQEHCGTSLCLRAISRVHLFTLEKRAILPVIEKLPGFFEHLNRQMGMLGEMISTRKGEHSPLDTGGGVAGSTLLSRVMQFFSRRRYRRISIPSELDIRVMDREELLGSLADIGKGGLRIRCSGNEKKISEGDNVHINIRLRGILEEPFTAEAEVTFIKLEKGTNRFGLHFPKLNEVQAGQISKLMESVVRRRAADDSRADQPLPPSPMGGDSPVSSEAAETRARTLPEAGEGIPGGDVVQVGAIPPGTAEPG